MKKTSLFILASLLTTLNLRADVLIQELFNYADGSITTNSAGVWQRHNGTAAAPGDAIVKAKRAEIGTTTAYLGVTVTRQDDVFRFITNNVYPGTAHAPLYASFIVNFTNLPTGAGAYFAHFKYSATGFAGRVFAQTNGTVLPGTFRLGIAMGGTVSKLFPSDLALNTDYQVVIGYNPTTGGDPLLFDLTSSIWVNPISSSSYSIASSDSFTPASNFANSFATRQPSSFGAFLTISNLVVATTFAEAATNGLSTNAVAPKIVSQPVGATNFSGATVAVAALASGQGQGDLIYQWQMTNAANPSPINVSNPGGNTNVLVVDTSVASTNYYTLIVTTPFGLSTTSSVAKVQITDAPVPPTFTVHPASQTVYRGQSVTFNTTVISPLAGDPVTFTWYSNNTVITAGQSDSGHSSSYTLTGVLTNFSAIYKVAATNAFGGLFSSNAVLTVSNPPTVSIAYLRSLIDPVTLLSTAPPNQPFQVTGVVTSYTNTTTGDTASYYLQDATAGINIFATFGSTFRPLQGDQVTYVGVLSSFTAVTGGLELFADTVNRPYTSYSIDSSGNPLPASKVIPFTATNTFGYYFVNTNLMGSRVTLTNVFFGARGGTVIATNVNDAVVVTNQNGAPFNVQFFSGALDTAGQTLPTFASSVTGNLIGSHPNVYLAVTKFSDIVAVVPSIPLGLSASGSTLTFNWSDPSFSLQTATNLLGPWSTVTGATSPFVTNTTPDPVVFYRLFHP